MNLLTKNSNTSRMNQEKTDKVFPIKGHKNVSSGKNIQEDCICKDKITLMRLNLAQVTYWGDHNNPTLDSETAQYLKTN